MPKRPFHTCMRRRSTAPLSTSPSSYSAESYRPRPLQLDVAPTLTLESPFRALAGEAHLLARWVVVEEAVGAVASHQRADTVLDLMFTDPTRYRRLDHLAEALHLVEAAVVVDIAVGPTTRTLLDLGPNHQGLDDEAEEGVMEQADVTIMTPDAAAAAAVLTTTEAQVETIGNKRKRGKEPSINGTLFRLAE